MSNFLTNIDYIFFVLIMWTIMFIFYYKYMGSNSRLNKIVIVLSFIIFVIILCKHYYDCHRKHELGIEEMDNEKLARLRNHSYIDPHNSAIVLLKNLLGHPMFGYSKN